MEATKYISDIFINKLNGSFYIVVFGYDIMKSGGGYVRKYVFTSRQGYSENEGGKFHRNFGTHLPDYTGS